MSTKKIDKKKVSKKPLNPKAKNWCFELYPEDNERHKYILALLSNYNYLYIKHDSDVWLNDEYSEDETDEETGEPLLLHKAGEYKKEHYHCILQFENARYKNALAEELGIEKNLLHKLTSFKSYVIYCTHRDYPTKAQYEIDDFHGSLKIKALKALSENTDDMIIREIINYIDSCEGYVSHKSVHNFVLNYGFHKVYRMYYNSFFSYEIGEHNEAYFKSKQNVKESVSIDNF